MLILPPGHAAAVAARRRLSQREKWILGSVLAAVAAVVIAIVISVGTAEHTTGGGCIDVRYPITIGGEEIYACGARAKSLCLDSRATGGINTAEAKAVQVECRKAGLPIG